MVQTIQYLFAFWFVLFSSDPLTILEVLRPDPGLLWVLLMSGGPCIIDIFRRSYSGEYQTSPCGVHGLIPVCLLPATPHPWLRVSAEAGRAPRTDSHCVFHRRGIWGLALGRGL